MKKILFLAAVTLAAASCLKDETVVVETPQELTFKPMAKVTTKADAQHEGTWLREDYRIYASATQKKADGTIENPAYFNEKAFDTETAAAGAQYHAWDEDADVVAPIYWPIGGCQLDYIAYAMPVEAHTTPAGEGPVATYENVTTDVASHLAFKGWDTYKNQVDVLYAVKNETTTEDNAGTETVLLEFKHAQALLVFEAKVNLEHVLQINQIKMDGLLVKGDFVVDNTKNNLVVTWNAAPVANEDIVAPGATPEDDNIHSYVETEDPTADESEYLDNTADFEQVGSTLLVPQQPALNFVVTYHVSGKEMTYEYNNTRAAWEMGKKYVYQLDFTLNEVVVTETVADYEDVRGEDAGAIIPLN